MNTYSAFANTEGGVLFLGIEEKENEFQVMVNEARQRRVQSYLEGLEVERNRLARELHDNVSNELVAIRMEIEGRNNYN